MAFNCCYARNTNQERFLSGAPGAQQTFFPIKKMIEAKNLNKNAELNVCTPI